MSSEMNINLKRTGGSILTKNGNIFFPFYLLDHKSSYFLELLLYRPQTKLREGKFFTGVCDSVHSGVWSWGVPAPAGCLLLGGGVWSRWCLVWGGLVPGGACSWGGGFAPRGCLVQGGCPVLGGSGPRGVPGGDSPRQLLLRTVHIL